MKSILYRAVKTLAGPELGEDCKVPAMREPIKLNIASDLGEDDELFLGYGMLPCPLPYTMQDAYDRAIAPRQFETLVLENDYLRAEFIPALGARLWSLFDKKARRDLVLDNPEFRPRNLAVRNAWFAGGVEWNIGRRGHDAQTCSPRFCAELKDTDGTPVLRIYEFNRDRAIPFQLDFFLPSDSRFLLMRGRIYNPNENVVPMYFWSNIAVPQTPGMRVVVPAENSYANCYNAGAHALRKIALPSGEGFDCTYPHLHWNVKDHFFNIPDSSRKFEAAIHADGYGLLFASTRRLQGRKLFVWGESQGGRHWQRKLVPEGTPDYIEIQGGLAKTQLECLPMPPKSAWEWLECYGGISLNLADVFGEWDAAVKAVSAETDRLIPEAELDGQLRRTGESFARKKGILLCSGSGWGALEELRRKTAGETPMAEHLDFGSLQAEQRPWAELLKHGRFPASDAVVSFQVQDGWFELLKHAPGDWQTRYHLGLNEYFRGDFERAEAYFSESLAEKDTVWGCFGMMNVRRVQNRRAEMSEWAIRAVRHLPGHGSLVKEVLKVLLQAGEYAAMAELYGMIPEPLRALPMIQFLHAQELFHRGRTAEAEAIITADGGLEIPDVREGENSVSELYIAIQCQKAKDRGCECRAADVPVPFRLDLRMVDPNFRK